jgi:peptidoglycan hydrolase-like protein with peptidoglycan-binding domain
MSLRRPSRRRARPATVASLAVALLVAAATVGCNRQSVEERAKATLEKIQKGMVDVEAVALEQKTDAATVTEVQRNLTAISEYQGEINGKLDSVTINAIQAFQRSAGIKDDGIIAGPTREKLAAAAAKSQGAGQAG